MVHFITGPTYRYTNNINVNKMQLVAVT